MLFNPEYIIKPDAIDPAVCDLIIQKKDDEDYFTPWRKARHGNPDHTINEEQRSSSLKWASPDHWITSLLALETAKINSQYWKFQITNQGPGQLAFYQKNDHYAWHSDIGMDENGVRKITIIAQLSDSDSYEGGDLELSYISKNTEEGLADEEERKLQIQQAQDIRQKGTVIIFPCNLIHRVTPITSGVRYSFTTTCLGPQLI